MTAQEILSTLSPLQTLPLALRKELWWRSTFVELAKGDALYTKGENSDGSLHMVVKGRLNVLFEGTESRTSTKPKGPGDLCGEIALKNNDHKRTTTVEVASDSAVLLRWEGDELLAEPSFTLLSDLLGKMAWGNIVQNDNMAKAKG
jgi:CRP-like cAMP-binding protein